MKPKSVWVVEERHYLERTKDWGPWTICSSMHTSETLAAQTMNEVKQKTKAKCGDRHGFVLGDPFEFRVVRYDRQPHALATSMVKWDLLLAKEEFWGKGG